MLQTVLWKRIERGCMLRGVESTEEELEVKGQEVQCLPA